MPRRSHLLTKCWSNIDLPILPFLAPRLFTPWPSIGQRAYSGAQTAQKHSVNEGVHDNDLLEADHWEQRSRKRDSTLPKFTPKGSADLKHQAWRAVDKIPEVLHAWANSSDSHGVKIKSVTQSDEAPFQASADEQFCKNYVKIWGNGQIAMQDMDLPATIQLDNGIPAKFESIKSLRDIRREIAEVVGRKRRTRVLKGHHAVQSGKAVIQKAPKIRCLESSIDLSPPVRTRDIDDEYDIHHRSTAVVRHQFRRKREIMVFRPLLTKSTNELQHLRDEKQKTPVGQEMEVGNYRKQFSIGRELFATGRDALRKGFRRPLPLPLLQPSSEPLVRVFSLPTGQSSSAGLYWCTRFSALCSRRKGIHKVLILANHDMDTEFGESLIRSDSSTSLRKVWEAVPNEKRCEIWPELMLTALDNHPTTALKVLVATYFEPWPPGYAVSDSFDYLISYYLGDRALKKSKSALDIFRAFDHIVRKGPPGHFQLSQKSIWLLLMHLDNVFVEQLLQTLTEVGHPLTKHTIMHFSSKVRFSNGPDERVDLLKKLWQAGSDFNSVEMLSVCATLLQKKNRSSTVGYSDSEVFELMLDCGMKPNIIIYNILLQNALEAGDPETAWKIHDMMIENGIETDAHTYSLLLTDAKLSGHRSSINRILNTVGERVMRNAHVATDILHMIYVFSQNHEPFPYWEEVAERSEPFTRMLTIYRRHFRLEPLTHIVPWFDVMYPGLTNSSRPNESELFPSLNEPLMEPEVPTLVVMLTALLNECSDPALIVKLYNHLQDLVIRGDPVATALSRSTTHLYNIILMALGRFPETLALCPRIIRDMLSANAEGVHTTIGPHPTGSQQSSFESSPKPQGHHPKPDVYTWSILLRIFMDHGQPRAAEKVLSMMQERKVSPNQATWNSLIVGYARMQDMNMTVNAVDRMKRNGFDLDGFCLKSLSFFQNRRALIEALKALEVHDQGRSHKHKSALVATTASNLNEALSMIDEGPDAVLHNPAKAADSSHDVVSSPIQGEEEVAEVEFVVGDMSFEEEELTH